MEQRKNPLDCKHYPLCEHLKVLVREIPPDLLITKTIVLHREAEPLCAECHDFEPKDIAETTE